MKSDVLRALPVLSNQELKEVHKRCSVLLGVSAGLDDQTQVDASAEDLWAVAVGQLRISNKGRGAPKIAPRRRSQKELVVLVEASTVLQAWLEQNLNDGWARSPKVKKLAMLNLIVRCVSSWLLKQDQSSSILSVLQTISDVGLLETALDDAFPGYLNSGMIHMLVEATA